MIRGIGRLSLLCMAAVGIITVAACSSSGNGTNNSDGGGSSDKKLRVGVVELDRSQLFSTQQHPAIQKALEARGWSVSFVDSKGSPAAAISAMQNLLQKGVDALVVQTYAANQLTAGIAAAQARKVPVFSTGGGDVGPGMAGAIQYIGAEPINNQVVASIKDKAKVSVLQLGYTPGAPCLARAKNLDEQLSGMSNVSVTKRELHFPGADQSSQTATTGWLQSNPASSGKDLLVWVCTSDALAGVLAAEKQLGRGPYPLYTWDLSAPAVQGVKDGTVTGVLYLPASESSEQLAQLIADEHAAGDSWTPKTVPAKSVIVTKDNVAQYEGQA